MRHCTLALLVYAVGYVQSLVNVNVPSTLYYKVNDTAFIGLPVSANYRRTYFKAFEPEGGEQIYRVCNGKNKKTCGFWEDVKTKKKVASGVTTYNKKKKALVIKKMKASDFGNYMIGNKKKSRYVIEKISPIPI
ncbi:Secreted salivary protein [Caenorhabditis elegans]|uniref:Secreted salivary protein n=1 Tax=Caenorhabditis elegans TaxID=6239 RepID=Q8MPT1_CAEEL|nr:Secreted salivary protein [Caenorhabditis elegans]CCD66999.1 Secreted salivary protein [Caenorhabditis elegans]|eukprot:NP_001024148.1 Uncharacterized protein CELE_T19H12.3 [Caenorhabditis elegans]